MMKKPISLALLAGWAISACLDDPEVFLNPAATAPVADDDSSGHYLADGGTEEPDSGEIVDPTAPRITLEITAESSLLPNAEVTLKLSGEAQEEITGGTVILALPTKAAMDHAGPGRPPYYPQGEELPVTASWELPAMDSGNAWEKTATIPAAVAGYYMAAAKAYTEGPDGDLGPYLSNNVHAQAWMLVDDSGGRLMEFYNDSLWPEGPHPGPVYEDSVYAETSDPYADPGERAEPRGSVYFEVVYYHGPKRGLQPARGAKITAFHYRYGSVLPREAETHVVPSTGLVALRCPFRGHYLKGKAVMPDTDHVGKSKLEFIPRFVVGRPFCRFTSPNSPGLLRGWRAAYMPWRHLNDAVHRLYVRWGYWRERIDWEIDWKKEKPFSRYKWNWRGNKIIFARYAYDRAWTAAHEYTHALHHKAMGGLWRTTNCKRRSIHKVSSYTCAFAEGLADYGGTVGSYYDGRDSLTNDEYWEDWDYGIGRPKGKIEGYIAALFHDLVDGGDEVGDSTEYSARYVAKVFKTCFVLTGLWRNDVSDFVWCLENRVNSSVHRRVFPGISPPSFVFEGATEPSDWDPDDIRSTWLLNLR